MVIEMREHFKKSGVWNVCGRNVEDNEESILNQIWRRDRRFHQKCWELG